VLCYLLTFTLFHRELFSARMLMKDGDTPTVKSKDRSRAKYKATADHFE